MDSRRATRHGAAAATRQRRRSVIAVSAQLIYSRWVRLGTALVASVLLDWLGDQLVLLKSPPPSSRLLDWLLAPGVYLALWMYPLHADPAALTIVWIVTTLILTAILY